MKRKSPVVLVHRVCAWCGKEFARETWLRPDRAEITTWGICRRCLEPWLDDEETCGESDDAAPRENRSADSA
jgi:hypothetical protein